MVTTGGSEVVQTDAPTESRRRVVQLGAILSGAQKVLAQQVRGLVAIDQLAAHVHEDEVVASPFARHVATRRGARPAASAGRPSRG